MADSFKDSTDIALKVQQALIARGVENPVVNKELAETKSAQEKIQIIKDNMIKILQAIGMDLTDDSIEKTPLRIAKMYIEEVFSGLNYANFPEVTTIDNKMEYTEIVRINEIALTSTCEHHFVTFDGRATLAYIPKNKILGLSKFNRLVRFFAQRPQVQERLTQQILTALQTILETDDVAVYICATHFCVKARGVMDQGSSTATLALGGVFKTEKDRKKEFLDGVSCKI